MTSAQQAVFCGNTIAFPSDELAELQDCNQHLDDLVALRENFQENGYMLIRGMHDREDVLAARRVVLRKLQEEDFLQPGTDLEDALINEGKSGMFAGGMKEMTHHPDFLNIIKSPKLMTFFDQFFGGPSLAYDYKWLRVVKNEEFTGFHYDVVYMGRGSLDLLTCWTPYHDVALDQGPLAICLGSPHFEKIKQTYGKMDVDRDHVTGWFSSDPKEITTKFGGQWATTNFAAGDVLIIGMYMMHGSLTNVTNRFRISSDTRYQLASEPVDERWVGENPIAHYGWDKGEVKSMEEARQEWRV